MGGRYSSKHTVLVGARVLRAISIVLRGSRGWRTFKSKSVFLLLGGQWLVVSIVHAASGRAPLAALRRDRVALIFLYRGHLNIQLFE